MKYWAASDVMEGVKHVVETINKSRLGEFFNISIASELLDSSQKPARVRPLFGRVTYMRRDCLPINRRQIFQLDQRACPRAKLQ